MPRNRKQKRLFNKPRNNLIQEYAGPVLHKINKPVTDVTLFSEAFITSGVLGTNGLISTISFSNFADITSFVGLYKYFEITGYKIDFSLATTTAATDSFFSGVVAVVPINTIVGESASSTVPNGMSQVMDLPGAIFVQAGATNKGQWQKPMCKQVYSTRNAVGAPRDAFNLVAYFNDIGVSETVGSVQVYLNLKFYAKEYSATL